MRLMARPEMGIPKRVSAVRQHQIIDMAQVQQIYARLFTLGSSEPSTKFLKKVVAREM
jgi:hypothetical protein